MTPIQPHKADSGATRTSPGRSQKTKQYAPTQEGQPSSDHVDLDNWLWSCGACLPGCVGVFSLRLLRLPRLASPVTLAVRADARDVTSIYSK